MLIEKRTQTEEQCWPCQIPARIHEVRHETRFSHWHSDSESQGGYKAEKKHAPVPSDHDQTCEQHARSGETICSCVGASQSVTSITNLLIQLVPMLLVDHVLGSESLTSLLASLGSSKLLIAGCCVQVVPSWSKSVGVAGSRELFID